MSGHNTGAVLEGKITRRGTSNGNDRGNAAARRARREWLVSTYAADRDVLVVTRYLADGGQEVDALPLEAHETGLALDALRQTYLEEWRGSSELIAPTLTEVFPACRCYRCGRLLTVDTVTVDRIVPGCKGGTYRRDNIRPACGHCNSETGGRLGAERRHS